MDVCLIQKRRVRSEIKTYGERPLYDVRANCFLNNINNKIRGDSTGILAKAKALNGNWLDQAMAAEQWLFFQPTYRLGHLTRCIFQVSDDKFYGLKYPNNIYFNFEIETLQLI